jgi:hypothetical protein
MNPLWNNLYDSFKDRRYGALFLSAFVVLLGLLILGIAICAILRELNLAEYFPKALPGIIILGLAWGFLKFRQARIRSRERPLRGSLSRDELRVARSKLMKDQSRNGL